MGLDEQTKTDLQSPLRQIAAPEDVRNSVVYGQLLLTMFVWGLAWPIGRLLATDLPPVSIAALRYLIVVPVLFGVLWARKQPIVLERKWVANFIVMGLLSTTLYQIFFLFGVQYAAASDDSIVIGMVPVLIAIMAALVLNERMTRTKALGFLFGLSGVIVIALFSPNTNVPNRLLGLILVFGGGLSYAVYTVLLRRFIANAREDSSRPPPSSLSILAWISLFGWIFLIPPSLLEAPWNHAWPLYSWLGILYLALVSSVVGYFFYVEGVSKIGASRASVFNNFVPVFGVITSVLLLGENFSPWTGVSFLLILTGVILVNRPQRIVPRQSS